MKELLHELLTCWVLWGCTDEDDSIGNNESVLPSENDIIVGSKRIRLKIPLRGGLHRSGARIIWEDGGMAALWMGISDDRFSTEASSGDQQVFQAIKVRLNAWRAVCTCIFLLYSRSFIKSHSYRLILPLLAFLALQEAGIFIMSLSNTISVCKICIRFYKCNWSKYRNRDSETTVEMSTLLLKFIDLENPI